MKILTGLEADRTMPNTGGWQDRHDAAVESPKVGEYGIVRMIENWQQYALVHKRRFLSKIGKDYVLGPQWQAIGEGLLGLLNGETGRLDCGTLDGFLRETMRDNGCALED